MTSIRDANGPIEDQVVGSLEAEWSVDLPAAYRRFLLTYNGGRPVPSSFRRDDNDFGSIVDRFLGIGTQDSYDLEEFLEHYLDRLPNGMFPIGYELSGDLICIGLVGPSLGQIFLVESTFPKWESKEAGVRRVIPLAHDFDAFLDSLIEIEFD